MCYMLKTYKRCTLKVPHEPFYPRNMCGATFSACLSQCFNAFSMWKQHEPFYQRNLCKKNTNPSILPSSRCSPPWAFGKGSFHQDAKQHGDNISQTNILHSYFSGMLDALYMKDSFWLGNVRNMVLPY
jgi:hypothetical protein